MHGQLNVKVYMILCSWVDCIVEITSSEGIGLLLTNRTTGDLLAVV